MPSDADTAPSAFSAAVNVFYDVPGWLVCGALGRGRHVYMGREMEC